MLIRFKLCGQHEGGCSYIEANLKTKYILFSCYIIFSIAIYIKCICHLRLGYVFGERCQYHVGAFEDKICFFDTSSGDKYFTAKFLYQPNSQLTSTLD